VGIELPARLNIAEYFIARPAREHAKRVAILGEPARVTYQGLAEQVNRAAGALLRSGCRPGDRVLIVLPDSVEFVAAFFGAVKIGAVAVPVNSMTRAADYAYYLADCEPRLAVVHASALAEFAPAAVKAPPPLVVLVGSATSAGGLGNVVGWEDWRRGARSRIAPHPTAARDTAFFLYTSGSGGIPKAVVHQHKDMLVTATSFAQGVLGLRADDRTFSVSKLFFAYGLGNGMYFPFSVGASTVLNPERTKIETVVALIARHRPTVFFGVPTFYAALVREAERGLGVDFSSVRMAVSAGEPLPAEIFERFRQRFGLEILDGIGSTEVLHMFISNRPGEARAGSCGVEVPNYEAQIVDDVGKPVPEGQIGNLWVKGQSAFAEYWNKPELTARTKPAGWVVTGDKFFRDSDGRCHYCGRSDDMMKVAGMWVSPGEVENALLGHPAVAEAAVVAGETDGLVRPVAYIALRAGARRSSELAEELRAFVRERLPSYKVPQEVCFLDELPKTATGKIQRFRLRERG
jgi:benzoate-CoA ligase family protein